MAKAVAFFIFMTLLLCISSTHAASRHPAADEPSSAQGFDEEQADLSCDGVGEEECLMRRTLVAHIDYIYTQGKIHD
ncbi:phytosulfokines 5-like [Dendrobium catenatum]|uniref:phytosulfokines 5-like n=1 Tax=Dendrobium catenatum TaxID=906689 RepID=UPI0009F3A3A0|nr:phytosulfokines 5-like [Dendrobium catenatum]